MEDEQSKNMVWESILLLEITILACILGLKFIFLMCTEGFYTLMNAWRTKPVGSAFISEYEFSTNLS